MTWTDISTREANPKFTGRWPHWGPSPLVMGHIQQYAVSLQYYDGGNQYAVTNYYYRLSNCELEYLSRYSDGLQARQLDSRQGYGIFLYSTSSRPALGSTQPPIQWTLGALSPGLKLPVREADHSAPSSAEVKNGGAIHLLPDTSSRRGALN
jgi:hypothetical protein